VKPITNGRAVADTNVTERVQICPMSKMAMDPGMNNALYQKMTIALINGDERAALTIVRRALNEGEAPTDIVSKGLLPGLDRIGAEYEAGNCFVPELVIAGRIMQSAMRILHDSRRQIAEAAVMRGKIVLGTVAGDVHTIGKDLVGTLLTLNGFEIIDLGFNVPPSTFVRTVEREQASILAMSALLVTTRYVQQRTIEAMISAGLRQQVKVIVGGAATSQGWADKIGADGFASNATTAVAVCHQLVENR
jgi:methanogenic corrinoid protein MtbC1